MKPAPLALALGLCLPALAQKAPLPPASMAWFGPGVQLTKGENIDLFWMKPGARVGSEALRLLPWSLDGFSEKALPRDKHLAATFAEIAPGLFQGALEDTFGPDLALDPEHGAWEVEGRILDYHPQQPAVRLASGINDTRLVFELKITNRRDGEVVLAAHHSLSARPNEAPQEAFARWFKGLARLLKRRASR